MDLFELAASQLLATCLPSDPQVGAAPGALSGRAKFREAAEVILSVMVWSDEPSSPATVFHKAATLVTGGARLQTLKTADDCGVTDVRRAFSLLAVAPLEVKEQLLLAALVALNHDHDCNPLKYELLRVTAAALGRNLPLGASGLRAGLVFKNGPG